MKRILIICNTNASMSQIAEAFLKHLTFSRVEVYSAGITPRNIHPLAIKVMKELGIDISQNHNRSVNEFYNDRFDYIITLQDEAREKSPIFQGSHTKIHKSLDDPGQAKGNDSQKLETFRKSRDQIKDWVTDFIERYQLL
jgi:arsenate reductase